MTIDGGNVSITISGGDAVRVFTVSSANFALNNLTVAHGNAATLPGGGGIFNNVGTLTVTNSTFSDNNASDNLLGGGIYNGGTLKVTNSTFSRNRAEGGGAIFTSGGAPGLEVTNSTFSGNSARGGSGGGIFNSGNGSGSSLSNTILANNTGGNCYTDSAGTFFVDHGYNISDDGSCGFLAPSKNDTPPQFAGGLANNGGPTQTIALQPSSPAVDAIPQGTNRCGGTATNPLTTDQRGIARPQGSACDIGAFELVPKPPTPPMPPPSGGGGGNGGGGHHHKGHHHGHHHGNHHKHKGGGISNTVTNGSSG